MAQKMQMKTDKTARKVIASATSGGVIGVPLAEVIIYWFETLANHDMPDTIEKATAAVIVVLVGWIVGRLVPPAPQDQIEPAT